MMNYTPQIAFELAERYKARNQYFAAELCYSLLLNKESELNTAISTIQSQKYENKLKQLKSDRTNRNMIIPNKGSKIPSDALKLLQSFYKPWLNKLKPEMKVCTAAFFI